MNTILPMLLPALIVSGTSALALTLSAGAPARLRLVIAAVGLLSWVIPWPMLLIPLMSSHVPAVAGWLADVAPGIATAGASAVANGSGELLTPETHGSFTWIATAFVTIALLPGMLMFLADVARHRRTLDQWRRDAMSGEYLRARLPETMRDVPHAIRVIPRSDVAAATGLFRGTIWIGDRLAAHPHLSPALLHECVHVARRDVAAIILVALIRRLYFWNPIVRYFAYRVGFFIEASCDERCARLLGRAEYRSSLAALILDLKNVRNMELVPMVKSARHDVARVAALARTPRLDARACIGAVLCVLGLGAAATLNAQATADPRIGSWDELKTSSHYDSLLRVLEPLDNGMVRMYVNRKLLEQNRLHVDFKCDGAQYRFVTQDGRFTGTTYSCRRAGPGTIESLFTYGKADPSVGTQPTEDANSARAKETVSADGKRFTIIIVSTLRNGQIRESRREFVRRK